MDINVVFLFICSSYNNLVCCCCEAVIGKMYHTTNQQMDMVRGNYSLLLHRLLRYFENLFSSYDNAQDVVWR